MDGIQIKAKNQLELITKREAFDDIDSVKIKVKKALLTSEDFQTLEGDPNAVYPIIPARTGIGVVTEINSEKPVFSRAERIFPHPEVPCRNCFKCAEGKEDACIALSIAGKNSDGFLRDFAVSSMHDVSSLPPSISDNDALFIDHIALCVNVLEAIDMHATEHIIIVGGDILGIILAQLVKYYQGVPILVDNNDDNIITAQNSGIYYTIYADSKLEKNAADVTGTRLSNKIVYMTGSGLNPDIALKIASTNSTVCFAGFATPSAKINLTNALLKNLQFRCVTNGFGAISPAINLLAIKAVDLGVFSIPSVGQEEAVAKITEMAKTTKKNASSKMLIVEMN